ncbi:hypothetical protein H2203_000746 [Taxawa tesnikishii (nom. ined.)]|nr:hypothetical protein H2203_000746 [Dothideales sp. JES 119]
MARYTPLPDFQRLITTHSSDGKAVFSSAIDETSKFKGVDNGNADFCLSYATSSFPVDMNNDADLERYKEYLVSPPGLVDSQGTVLRHVDIKPGFTSPMHRTVSLDYGIVLMGEVELILDSGEKKIMKAGDIAIQAEGQIIDDEQRGTNHAWRNTSDTEWARMMYILQPARPLEIEGKRLGEDLGDMEGVRKST